MVGERQAGKIERSHEARYKFALSHMKPGMKVLDVFCGSGYGSELMQAAGMEVTGFDKYSKDGNKFKFVQGEFPDVDFDCDQFDAITCFEAIEHIKPFVAIQLLACMRMWIKQDGQLWISTPNQYYMPYEKARYPFHIRHYTPSQLETDLNLSSFDHVEWFNQEKKGSVVFTTGFNGCYMIAKAS